MSYIENTRGYYTASKLKMLKLCPELFEKLYITEELKEYSEELDSEDALLIGTLFHKFREEMSSGGKDNREETIREKCYITNEYLKADFILKILERIKCDLIMQEKDDAEIRIELEANEKRLKKTTVCLEDLQIEWYGSKEWAKMQTNIPITRTQFKVLVWMMESTMKQKIRDFNWKYSKEETINAVYAPQSGEWSITLWIKPDRLVFIKYNWEWKEIERYTLEEYEKMTSGMKWKEKEEFATQNNIKALLRDFKTIKPGWIAWIKKELQYEQETRFWYVFSMGFYYTVVYVKYATRCDVWIDFVEKGEPYLTEVVAIPLSFLHQQMTQNIIPTLQLAIEYSNTWVYPSANRTEVLENKDLRKYYQYFSNIQQTEPWMIDLCM